MATVTAVRYTGLIFCPTVSTGAFVARRNGRVFLTGNSGFPKSLDVSKAIDKAAGAEREVIGSHAVSRDLGGRDYVGDASTATTVSITAPATDAARQWQGWGTALKPSLEPVTVARKPLSGTVAENVLAHGTGALNIDGCRVAASDEIKMVSGKGTLGGSSDGWDRPWKSDPNALAAREARAMAAIEKANELGRWPANLILSIPEDEYSLRDDVTPDQLRQLAEWMGANP